MIVKASASAYADRLADGQAGAAARGLRLAAIRGAVSAGVARVVAGVVVRVGGVALTRPAMKKARQMPGLFEFGCGGRI